MSDDSQTSPSLLNLRQYRFKKKPPRISDLDSSSEIQQNTISTSSDLDNNDTPTEDDKKDATTNQPTVKQEPDVKSKEKHLRILVSEFPHIDTMTLQDTLLKANWDSEAAKPMLANYVPPPKHSYRKSNYFQNRTIESENGHQNNHSVSSLKREPPSNNGPKRKRLRRTVDSDDSEDEARHESEKVYDSDEDSDVEVSDNLTGDRKKVFDFLNTANANELRLMASCSQKRVDNILSERPFKGWLDMVNKFQENKYLTTDILNSAQHLISSRNNLQRLMSKCSAISRNLEIAVANGAGVKQQPEILNSSMKLAGYQLVGLNWLVAMHQQNMNGILADEMGLGKTVQVIAFLGYLKERCLSTGTHLVVVPASTLDNWSNEFERWCPMLNVVMYYGSPDERRMLRINWVKGGLSEVDVILTTYTMVSSSPEERKMFRVTQMHYVIFDEAHMLKNMNTQRYDNLIKIKASRRILLTGTPLQNNLLELMSLLCFVMPSLFDCQREDLKSLFQKNSKTNSTVKKGEDDDDLPLFEQTQITQAKKIMKPFVLRRLKRDVLKDLPKKTDYTEQVPMTPSQKLQYEQLIQTFSSETGEIHANKESSGMTMMMEMRKLSNHPMLLRYYYDDNKLQTIAKRLVADSFYKGDNYDYVYEDLLFMSDFQIHQLTMQYKSICGMNAPDDLIVSSGKFAYLDKMLEKLKSEGHRVLIFSQFVLMLDVLESYLKIRGYSYLRLDGSTMVTERQELIDRFNEDEEIFIFLLSTRAGGLGINLTAADTVIIHDIDFNPYNDKQAEDRCHRMGQKRPVTIYRLISKGTIEEGMLQVAREKLNLEREVTTNTENDPQEVKNVVRLLTLALGVDSNKAANLLTPSPRKSES
ncbi:SWI/SNF-related matrix-associated actin-dependent regulator of chromatin subfamily A containing DEAD/H box 1 homolog [Ctenocephalides felis]|uniref:SWI/SNF-related matrix-associated actin-dependent regulator of chromatin subfamily A containing DEAD/H box 1 homolog n=1 Tax=Ctenocephalides felis TaxID=7515 RepID=UPI000E6E4737|nr:SWI/SNF-related matrix-associated actin-dependent regulator of chromatin subfamily A containing DEAD/H box 1 homolog [Ctenocephalides felis]